MLKNRVKEEKEEEKKLPLISSAFFGAQGRVAFPVVEQEEVEEYEEKGGKKEDVVRGDKPFTSSTFPTIFC